ncbi:MAG: RNA ligase [Candidatus Pacearchaeota archaeon]
MELEIQKYLRNGGTPAELTEKYAIAVKPHGKYPNLLLFKYNQIDSPMGERIVQEARGIILDSTNNWAVVCYTMRKFFNHGEGHADKIDLSTAKAYEKLDGSLMQVFFYNGEWLVSSSGLPDASGEISGGFYAGTFADLFWDVWKQLGYSLPVNEKLCYGFEMVTQYNRVVCVYPKPRIALHSARDVETLEEQEPERIAKENKWDCVKSYPMQSLEEVAEMAKDLNAIDNGEGYVVRDLTKWNGSFGRVKIKNPQYVALHHIKEGISAKKLVEIIRTNESTEFLTYFPEYRAEFERISQSFIALVKKIEAEYEKIKDISGQKDFALEAVKFPFSGVLFSLRKGLVKTVKQGLQEMNLDRLYDWVK